MILWYYETMILYTPRIGGHEAMILKDYEGMGL